MAEYRDFLPEQRVRHSVWVSMTVSVSADGTQVAYISDASGQFNVCVRSTAGGPERQLTFFTAQSVREVAFTPDGSAVVFTVDTGGDEQFQVHTVPVTGGDPVRLPGVESQHFLAEKTPFDGQQRLVAYSGPDPEDPSVPDVIVCELASGKSFRFAGPAYSNTFVTGISSDGRRVLAGVLRGNTDCQSYVADIDTGGGALEPVTGHLPGEFYYPAAWAGDSTAFYVRTTAGDGEHVSVGRVALDGDRPLQIVDAPPWDVEDVAASGDGRTVVWLVNENGCSVLRGRRDDAPLDIPALPAGVVSGMSVSGDGSVVTLLLDTPGRPTEVAIVRPGTTEPVRYLTDARPPLFRTDDAVTPEQVGFPSGDGTLIPAWLYRPIGPGPHPAVVWVHGGPEAQARPQYDALHQCLLANGIGLLMPNIRGSSGYGRAWQTRVYRDWGGIDLEDLAGAHAWLTGQPWVAAGKIAVAGGSYGGFAALSCITRQPDMWTAGVSLYGPANLNTLAAAMPPSWAGTIAAHFGDPSDPAVAEDLRRRSPLTYADQIAAPLLVVQGANDPRTPRAESDQIIEAARANGADVEYVVFGDEGHGFTARDNDIRANDAIISFLVKHLST
jgi:dipeptidyl aminopeptidase/acylaminoacyl peptidase